MLFLRNDVEANFLPMSGQLFQHNGEKIRNFYTYKIVNKTEQSFDNVTVKIVNYEGEIKLVGSPVIKVPKQGLVSGTLYIDIPENLLKDEKVHLKLELYNGERLIEETATNFQGPRNFN